jgi:hypothetical protein
VAASANEHDFFDRLEHAGLLVRKRFSTRNPGEVTGYSVAQPRDVDAAGQPIWFGGGRLAADLTLPKLRRRWENGMDQARTVHYDQLTAQERAEIWDHAGRVAAQAAQQIQQLAAAGDHAAPADAAWAAADTLHSAASALGSRALRAAARTAVLGIPRQAMCSSGLEIAGASQVVIG